MQAEQPSIAAVAALDDDVRRALYECVRDARRPVTREDAAASVGISRKLAAFHLDKLVGVGLLRARYETSGTRRVGRTPKVYEPSGDDIAVSIPARRHALLAEILLDAVLAARSDRATSAGRPDRATSVGRPDRAAHRVARAYGERIGAAERDRVRPGRLGAERGLALAGSVCERHGFDPCRSPRGTVRLRNCPFHPLAARAPDVVCAVNHEFLSGLLTGLGARGVEAVLEARPGECCVELRPARATRS